MAVHSRLAARRKLSTLSQFLRTLNPKQQSPIRKSATLSPDSDAARHILAGARQHFFAHGFRGVTMDDLAEELGMSKKTLYAHFPSKTALLEAVIADKLRSVEAGLKGVMGGRAADFPAMRISARPVIRCRSKTIITALIIIFIQNSKSNE